MVANDSREAMDPALTKACRIEHYSGAEILVAQSFYHPIAEEPAEILPAKEQTRLLEAMTAAERDALTALVEPHRGRVASIESRLIWSKDAKAAIVETAAEWRAQLLIKPVSRHRPLADFFHTPLDWALMRDAPCPVLISKSDCWGGPNIVLAAVDVADAEHATLNREILRRAASLAQILGAELHVACAYPDLGQAGDQLQVAADFAGIKADMKESRRRTLVAMLQELGLAAAEIHLLEGRPSQVIPGLAGRLQASLTVLGSAARRGISKLVIGNTAEDLIGRIEGDLMTVREPWS
jgi:universal stress protein E